MTLDVLCSITDTITDTNRLSLVSGYEHSSRQRRGMRRRVNRAPSRSFVMSTSNECDRCMRAAMPSLLPLPPQVATAGEKEVETR